MTTAEPERVPPLEVVLDQWVSGKQVSSEDMADLRRRLIEREDQIATMLRLAGMQFGLFPQIVAEVLAESGLGIPPTPEARDMIHRQFHALMEQIARAQGGDGPMPTP